MAHRSGPALPALLALRRPNAPDAPLSGRVVPFLLKNDATVRARFLAHWLTVRESLWFVPALITGLSALLALVTVQLDAHLQLPDWLVGVHLFFLAGSAGARGVLGAISGTMITVTGLVFSLTLVALQLASTQYSPRVLRSFTGSVATQLVLGVFIGTFTYALLVQRTIRGQAEDLVEFVPSISVNVAIMLVLLSVVMLIFYIHHITRSIQASVIIDRVTNDTNHLVDELFPSVVGQAAEVPEEVVVPADPAGIVTAAAAGYLQAVDGDALFDLASRGQLVIRMQPAVGEFILPGAPLAAVWPAHLVDEDVVQQVRTAFVQGLERTLQHDVELGVRQLVDIALKALSPGINDPSTAMMCVDRLAEVLVNLGRRRPPARVRRDEAGQIRFIAYETTFPAVLEQSFDHVRHYGHSDTRVMVHLLKTLGRLALLVPQRYCTAIAQEIEAVVDSAGEAPRTPRDTARLISAAKEALAIVNAAPNTASLPVNQHGAIHARGSEGQPAASAATLPVRETIGHTEDGHARQASPASGAIATTSVDGVPADKADERAAIAYPAASEFRDSRD